MKSATSLAYWFMPESLMLPIVMVLVVAGIFFWVIGFRGIGRSMLLAAVGFTVIPALLSPLLEEILMQIPTWMVVVFLVALGFYLVRLFLTLFLGKEGAGTLMAMAVAGTLRAMVMLPSLVSRGVQQLSVLMNSPSPGRRVLGMALAILLAMFAGLLGRQVADGQLAIWDAAVPYSASGTASSPMSALLPMVVDEDSSDYETYGKRQHSAWADRRVSELWQSVE